MSIIADRPTLPIPVVDLDLADFPHTSWCAAHDNVGHFDQHCQSERWILTAESDLPADPSRVEVTAFRPAGRPGAGPWFTSAPGVEVFVPTDEPGLAGLATLTVEEARLLAARLLELADQIDGPVAR